MTATPAARVFASEVSLSFDRVTAAAEACGRPSTRHILRVSAPTTFALRWLIPRLEQFHAARPQVEVAVTTTATLHDELRGGFDIAIRGGSADPGAWPQYQAVSFLPEADTLIVSPTLFERAPLHQPADIASHVLLGARRVLAIGPTGWNVQVYRTDPKQRRRVFDHFFVTHSGGRWSWSCPSNRRGGGGVS
jgi:LysR family transcriptional regulator, glycine cleavage system transcriptional activator